MRLSISRLICKSCNLSSSIHLYHRQGLLTILHTFSCLKQERQKRSWGRQIHPRDWFSLKDYTFSLEDWNNVQITAVYTLWMLIIVYKFTGPGSCVRGRCSEDWGVWDVSVRQTCVEEMECGFHGLMNALDYYFCWGRLS
jgi:hypothetical protein